MCLGHVRPRRAAWLLLLLLLSVCEVAFPWGRKEAVVPQNQRPVLVFTCLGRSLWYQAYIWPAIEQARLLNPQVPIYVVFSAAVYIQAKGDIKRWVKALDLKVEIYDEIQRTNLPKAFKRYFFIATNLIPKDGNPLFVRTTTERLFAVHELATLHNLTNVFHLENDNMMYVDLHQVTRTMHQCRVGIGIPVLDHEHAALSFVYFRGAAHLRQLAEFIVGVYRLGRFRATELLRFNMVTDMTVTRRFLATVSRTTDGLAVTVLPSWNLTRAEATCVWDRQDLLYDAAPLGQFFGGTHLEPNVRGWYEPHRPYKALKNKTLQWRQCPFTSKSLLCPWIDDRRVANLHVHSKSLARFSSKNALKDLPT